MCNVALKKSKLSFSPFTSLTVIGSCELAPDSSLLYYTAGNVSVQPLPNHSFSTGTDLSSVDGRPLCRLSEELTSARCTQISRWKACLCGSSAIYVLPGSYLSPENPRSLASPLFKTRRFLQTASKWPVGACKLSSVPKGWNISSLSSQTL